MQVLCLHNASSTLSVGVRTAEGWPAAPGQFSSAFWFHVNYMITQSMMMSCTACRYTPVHRIFDLSHNDLAGAFPVWLITSLPLLMSTCKCTVGISLDGDAFSCPAVVARANRKAQEILHSFEYLQCVSSTATGKQQQVRPTLVLISGGESHHLYHQSSPAEHVGFQCMLYCLVLAAFPALS